MASLDETQQTILDLIAEVASTKPDTGQTGERLATHKGQAEAILKLAEALAWVRDPGQSH
jgi:hypothetical protein